MTFLDNQKRKDEGGSPVIGPVPAIRTSGAMRRVETPVAIIGFAGSAAVVAKPDGSLELVGVHDLRIWDRDVKRAVDDAQAELDSR